MYQVIVKKGNKEVYRETHPTQEKAEEAEKRLQKDPKWKGHTTDIKWNG